MRPFTTEIVRHGGIIIRIRSWLLVDLKVRFCIRPVHPHPDKEEKRRRANAGAQYFEYDIDDGDDLLSSWPGRHPDMMSLITCWFPPHELDTWNRIIFYYCKDPMELGQGVISFDGCPAGIGFGIDVHLANNIDFPSSLMQFKFDDDVLHAREECAICLGGDEKKVEDLTCLPCSHIFHYSCVTNWFLTKHTCPMCRYAMPMKGA